jgi:hypothetical protein
MSPLSTISYGFVAMVLIATLGQYAAQSSDCSTHRAKPEALPVCGGKAELAK